mmetsp:Transcript_10189/g.21363  ORF Transcript_10189/g.21363 Transcript_10189/m.21363 type:complete len:209 (+) Transcript_10189:963-1589(+)
MQATSAFRHPSREDHRCRRISRRQQQYHQQQCLWCFPRPHQGQQQSFRERLCRSDVGATHQASVGIGPSRFRLRSTLARNSIVPSGGTLAGTNSRGRPGTEETSAGETCVAATGATTTTTRARYFVVVILRGLDGPGPIGRSPARGRFLPSRRSSYHPTCCCRRDTANGRHVCNENEVSATIAGARTAVHGKEALARIARPADQGSQC